MPLGLQKTAAGWQYIAKQATITERGPTFTEEVEAPFQLNIKTPLDGPAVTTFYEELLSYPLNDSRSLALMAAASSAWLSIFAEQIKAEGLQIPTVVLIGKAQTGKTSIARACSLLKPTEGGPPLSITAETKKSNRKEILEAARYGQLILSDLRPESARKKGIYADLLDQIIRPVAEEADTVGSVLVTAEDSLLSSRDLIASLRERLIFVPIDSITDTREGSDWLKNLKSKSLIGDLLASVLPALLNKLNTDKWGEEFKKAYSSYSEENFTPGHLREENSRFLLRFSHCQILEAAERVGSITSAFKQKAWERVVEISDWFFKSQLLLADPLGGEALHLLIGDLSSSIRQIKPQLSCGRYLSSPFPDGCFNCRHFDAEAIQCLLNVVQPQLEEDDLILYPDEIGFAIKGKDLPEIPKYGNEDSCFLLVRRDAFFEAVEEAAYQQGKSMKLKIPLESDSDVLRLLRTKGLVAYTIRDAEKGHADFAFKWPSAEWSSDGSILLFGNKASALLLQVPASWQLTFPQKHVTRRRIGKNEPADLCKLAKMRFERP